MSKINATGKLRIIGGNWRGRNITFSTDNEIRPSPDRVRETLFNWLQFDIRGTRCLELYAGSGILSLEALSRGAAHVTLVEKSRPVCQHLTSIMDELNVGNDEFDIACTTARNYLLKPKRAPAVWEQTSLRDDLGDGSCLIRDGCDILFLDPPFDSHELAVIEPMIPRILHADSIIYLESGSIPGQSFAGLTRHREGKAGKVHFALYR